MTIQTPPRPTFNVAVPTASLSTLFDHLSIISRNPPSVGNRHMALWRSAIMAAESGLTQNVCLAVLWEVNAKWPVPKSLEELKAAVDQGYKKIATSTPTLVVV